MIRIKTAAKLDWRIIFSHRGAGGQSTTFCAEFNAIRDGGIFGAMADDVKERVIDFVDRAMQLNMNRLKSEGCSIWAEFDSGWWEVIRRFCSDSQELS